MPIHAVVMIKACFIDPECLRRSRCVMAFRNSRVEEDNALDVERLLILRADE